MEHDKDIEEELRHDGSFLNENDGEREPDKNPGEANEPGKEPMPPQDGAEESGDVPEESSLAEENTVPEEEIEPDEESAPEEEIGPEEDAVPETESPADAETPAEEQPQTGTDAPAPTPGEGEKKRAGGKAATVALAIAAIVLAILTVALFCMFLSTERKVKDLEARQEQLESGRAGDPDPGKTPPDQPGNEQGGEIPPVILPKDPKEVTVVTVNDAVVRVAQTCSPSVVTIRIKTSGGSGSGSGVVWSSDGYIVTNNHVVEDAVSVRVVFSDGSEYPATVIATNADTDLALIRINAEGLTPATPGNGGEIVVGETAIAIGNPLGTLANTVTDGIVSSLARDITVDGTQLHVMQISCAINPGNSGGGCFNGKGELIGIVNAKKSASGIEGLGFAIPIDTVKSVISEMIENDHSSLRKSLGMTNLIEVNAENYSTFSSSYLARLEQLNGAPLYGFYIYGDGMVDYVDEKATFSEGDVIVSVDGKTIAGREDIEAILSEKNVGDEVTVVVKRLVSYGFFSSRYSLEEETIAIRVVMMYR